VLVVQSFVPVDFFFESTDLGLVEPQERMYKLDFFDDKHLACHNVHGLVDFPGSSMPDQVALLPLHDLSFDLISLLCHIL